MEVNTRNADSGLDAVFEGVLTTGGEDEYWLSQNQKSVKLHTSRLDEDVLEQRVGEPVSIVGMLTAPRDEGSLFSYELGARRIADLEGFNPENDTYVTNLGGRLIEAYENGVEEFEGDLGQLETNIENVAY